jgi:HSP90 family molecular chaperone
MTEQKTEKFEFQSEIKQLLDILVYSLYKNKEVFVRELISNAVDALNKVQFEIMTNPDIEDKESELKINISFNQTQNKFIIEDTGIGMTHKELIENIGTIAHSGTMDFLKRLSEAKEKEQIDLIGKFGVGFYSSFMVSKEIHIYTKSYKKGSKGYLWKSKGGTTFTIEEAPKKSRGTRIELLLKKGEQEFLQKNVIKNIISKYSQFVPFPIYLEGEKIEVMEAIWSQPKTSLKEKDYIEFYKFFENTQEEPEAFLHLSSDAPVQFHSILFIPKTSLELLGLFKTEPGVDLYSKKVLIQKGCKDIMPDYLRFVKGVIDSEDVPLNISRETIQNNIKIDKIRKHILKKLFSYLNTLKDKEREKYLNIWKNFNRNLKEGIATDFNSRETLSHLLLFHSSQTGKDQYTDLKDYIKRMKENQKEIYYVTGMDLESIDKNPALEAFKSKEIEVLYLDEPLDELVLDHLQEYDGKRFNMVESAEIKLDKAAEIKDEDYLKDAAAYVTYLKKLYGDRIKDVKVSQRLVDSPCILVHSADSPSLQMEKVMKIMNKDFAFTKRIMEINLNNDLIKGLVRIHKETPLSDELKILSLQLLDNLLLREGIIDNIDDIVPRIQNIMLQAVRKEE